MSRFVVPDEYASALNEKWLGITILCLFFLRFVSILISSPQSSSYKSICIPSCLTSLSHFSSFGLVPSSSDAMKWGDGTWSRVFRFLWLRMSDLPMQSLVLLVVIWWFCRLVTSVEDIGLNTDDDERRRWRLLEPLGDRGGGSGIVRTSKQSAMLKPSRKWAFCDILCSDTLRLIPRIGFEDGNSTFWDDLGCDELRLQWIEGFRDCLWLLPKVVELAETVTEWTCFGSLGGLIVTKEPIFSACSFGWWSRVVVSFVRDSIDFVVVLFKEVVSTWQDSLTRFSLSIVRRKNDDVWSHTNLPMHWYAL